MLTQRKKYNKFKLTSKAISAPPHHFHIPCHARPEVTSVRSSICSAIAACSVYCDVFRHLSGAMTSSAQQECLETAPIKNNEEAGNQNVRLTANQKKKRRRKLSKLKQLYQVQLWYCSTHHNFCSSTAYGYI